MGYLHGVHRGRNSGREDRPWGHACVQGVKGMNMPVGVGVIAIVGVAVVGTSVAGDRDGWSEL